MSRSEETNPRIGLWFIRLKIWLILVGDLHYFWFLLHSTSHSSWIWRGQMQVSAASGVHMLLLMCWQCVNMQHVWIYIWLCIFPPSSITALPWFYPQAPKSPLYTPNDLNIDLQGSDLHSREWDLNSWIPVSVNCGWREQRFPRERRPSGGYVPLEDDLSSSLWADAQYVLVTLPVQGWIVRWCYYLKIKQNVTHTKPLIWHVTHINDCGTWALLPCR